MLVYRGCKTAFALRRAFSEVLQDLIGLLVVVWVMFASETIILCVLDLVRLNTTIIIA